MRTTANARTLLFVVVTALALLGAACSKTYAPVATGAGSSTSTARGGGLYGNKTPSSPAATSTVPANGAAAGGSIAVATNASLGSIIVDDRGFTLYVFDKDTGTQSTCVDSCAKLWPPAAAAGTPTAGAGVDATKLSTITRTDGTTQLVYNGHPLYRYAADTAAGETNGQGVGSVWYVVGADGNKVDKG